MLGLALFLSPVQAQEREPSRAPLDLSVPGADELQVLGLANGSTLIGRIVEIGPDSIRFASGEMELTIPVADIREMRKVPADSVRGGSFWFPNPNRTRLFFAPTGRALPRGSGYLADHLLFFPGFAYGLTDHITIGGGMSVFPGVSWDEQIAFATPKFGWRLRENLDVAVGALLVAFPGNGDSGNPGGAGVLFSTLTTGSPDASVTAGVGYGYAGDGLAEKPMVMLGGERRIARRISLVTENWVFPGVDRPLISLGVRFLGERLSVDLAAVHPLGEDGGLIPLLGFVFAFGER